MKMKYLLVFLFLLFVFPTVSSAQCSYERQAELSRIASNVQFSYSYDENDEGYPIFSVNMTNVTNDIYVVDYVYGTRIYNSEYSFVYKVNGVTLKYDILSNDANCPDEKIVTKNITLPAYNLFNNIKKCRYYPNFKYCQMWSNLSSISQEQFDDEFDKYLKSKEVTESNGTSGSNEKIKDFVLDNIVWVVFIVLLIIITPVLLYVKRKVEK